ncbi:snoRNA-binding rRNA-processing protein UTP10 [Rhodotorula paludigena]|uniref:snoRNA-binding rRNA-processing protein UTP10 n=1 Tax=Rhodotorula paludigena TaxID=86838 RepID=UPI00316EC6B9
MATSLAAQLQARQTVDGARLQSQRTLKQQPTFVFTPRHAASLTSADLHSLAANAWDQLAALDPFFAAHYKDVLGEQAKSLDRTGLTKEENEKVGKMVDKVLRALGKHMLLKPAGLVLEWLVRRFRVQDFNIPGLIALFLPYHNTPHFPSALNLIAETTLVATPFASLLPAKKSLQPVALPSLIDLLPPFSSSTNARPFLDSVLHLPLAYLEQGEVPHRALTAFWLQAIAGYLDRAGARLPDGERAAVLSTVLEVLRTARSHPDTLIASYILVARFAMHNPFDAETLRVVLKGVVSNRARSHVADDETDAALVTTLVVISQLGEDEVTVGEGKKFLGNSGWKSLLRMAKLDELLVQLSNQYDAQRFLKPFLQTLAEEALESEECRTLLSSLLVPRPSADLDGDKLLTLPEPVISHLLASCFSALIRTPAAAPADLLKPLSQVYQRYPAIWTTLSKIYTSRARQSGDKDALARLLQAMNAVLGGEALSTDMRAVSLVLSASAPDVAIRVSALRDMLQNVDDIVAQGNEQFVRDTLRARLAEPEKDVAAVLFAKDAQVTLEAHVPAEELLAVLQPALDAGKDDYLAIALPYLVTRFVQHAPEQADALVKRVVWPRLLIAKSDRKVRVAAFKALKGSHLEKVHAWLKGLGAVLPQATDAVDSAHADKVVETLAKNMAGATADVVDDAIAFLLEQITTGKGEQAALAYLVALRFVGKVEKTRRVAFVGAVLEALKVQQTGLDPLVAANPDKVVTLVAADNAGVVAPPVQRAVFEKPTAEATHQLVRGALLVGSLKAVHPSKEANWMWLVPSNSASDAAYCDLCAAVYALAHAHAASPASTAIATSLLEILFGGLVADDALAFLAWLHTADSRLVSVDLRLAALRDAAVFVQVFAQATAAPKGKLVDWQVIVPSLIVALADADKRIRVEAVKALEQVRTTLAPLVGGGKSAAKVGSVYGRDKFYGATATASALQYLDAIDVVAYLDKLLASRTELILSPVHLKTLHSTLLDVGAAMDSPAKRRRATLSSKITTYLLSHVAAWSTSLSARVKLLQALEGVKDKGKSAALVALVQEAVDAPASAYSAEEPDTMAEYARLVLQPFDGAPRKWLEGDDVDAVATFVKAIEVPDLAGLRAALRKEALRLTAKSVFATVRPDTRLELLKRLIKLSVTTEARIASDVLSCVRAAKPDGETVTAFINEVRTALAPPVAKGAKRGRTSVGGPATSAVAQTERLPELVTLLESVDFASVPASHTLLLGLFDLLATLVDLPSSAGQTDVAYPGQLILGALARVVENVQPSSGVTSDSIRMAPVLDFMRSSVNPQTYSQSLLLLSQLGPLVPDQLVHNVMPIFTFMGANVLQRDDAYSLRVVDQTLDNIVPALVKAMQRTAGGREGLLSELKDLLRAFTDAAAHVPRHRRINLFTRLVETLGAKDFLSAVAMLLVDKAGKSSDAGSLPLSLVEHFSVEVQLAACNQVVEEIARLINLEQSFLRSDAAEPELAKVKDQALALLNFLAFALDTKQLLSKVDSARIVSAETVDTSLTELVRGLLDLSSATSPSFGSTDRADIVEAADYAVHVTVALMSTRSFADALLWLLELADPAIQPRAFALLRARLPHVKPTRRGDLTSAIVAVVEQAQEVLLSAIAEQEEVLGALETLDAVADAPFADEDAALAKTVPSLIEVAKSESKSDAVRSRALAILAKLSNRLGPRLIPLVAKLVPFALDVLKLQAHAGANAVTALVSGAYATLEGLFSSVPTFIGAQLDKVFSAALSPELMSLSAQGASIAKSRAALLSTAAKKLPAKTLYPAIIRLHASLSGNERDPLLGLLDLLNRALRYGKTTDVAENFRPVFKLFLTVFDLRRAHSPALSHVDVVSVEDHALSAFVQFILKLNEQTFRPLFLRTYDWAVIDLAESNGAADADEAGLTARRTVLYKIVDRLLGQLRSIFVPYFSFMLDQTVELLEAAAKGEIEDNDLWAAVASALGKALEYDENGFWTPARLAKLSAPLAAQLEAPASLFPPAAYSSLLASYAEHLASHESHLKAFNARILHLTRSDDLRVKRAAIDALDQLWDVVGDGMLGLVPETTPFLAEAREETEGGVEAATRRLIKRIEEHLGEELDQYLEQ